MICTATSALAVVEAVVEVVAVAGLKLALAWELATKQLAEPIQHLREMPDRRSRGPDEIRPLRGLGRRISATAFAPMIHGTELEHLRLIPFSVAPLQQQSIAGSKANMGPLQQWAHPPLE